MKKRLFAILLAVCMAVSMLALPASAAGLSNTAIQTAVTLGAMEPDRTGSLDAAVTRGALAKMLVGFSAYRDSAAKQGNLGTLYKDVPSSLDCAPYVRIAVQQGWMNGYTDGTFRPDNAVTLEEACTAVLKMLGYKMTDLNGAFPDAQLNKAQELGLRNQLGRARGETMNYEDCAILLYNALTANTASGGSYGSSLGFTVSNGQVDVSSVMLKNLQGPFVAGAEPVRCVLLQRKSADSMDLYPPRCGPHHGSGSQRQCADGSHGGGHQLYAGQHGGGLQGVQPEWRRRG